MEAVGRGLSTIVMPAVIVLLALALTLAVPAVGLGKVQAQAPVTPTVSVSEADYAMAAYTGTDPVTIATLESAQAKVACQKLTAVECDHSYTARTNAFAKLLGVPAILEDTGDNVGRLTFAGLILNSIGHFEYPDATVTALRK